MKNTKSMICNKLKDKLPEGWREQFVHRDCDQANYEFAMFEIDGENKILVRNPDTDDIMEYYYDDFDGKISIAGFMLQEKGAIERDNRKYYVDRKYYIYSEGNTKNRKDSLFKYKINLRSFYPLVGFYCLNNSKERLIYNFLIHRLIAVIFIPNPKPGEYHIVNHKNKDKSNFRKENLEWCSAEWNMKKSNRSDYFRRYYIKDTGEKFTYIDLENLGIDPKTVSRYAKNNKPLDGHYWKVINPVLENYLSRHPIDPNGWYDDNGLHDFGEHKVRANVCGVLEVDGRLTVGWYIKETYNYRVKIENLICDTHRLIFEIISQKRIDNNNVIDHINPVGHDPLDLVNNSYLNLREVTQKENLLNPITTKIKSTPINVYNLKGDFIKQYGSVKEAVEDGMTGVTKVLRGEYFQCGGHFYVYASSDSKNQILDKLKYIYYRFNSAGALETWSENFAEVYSKKINSNQSRSIRRKFLNTGVAAEDGYYYQQGEPHNMLRDSNNYSLSKYRLEIRRKKEYKSKKK